MKIYMSKVQNCFLLELALIVIFSVSAVQADIFTVQFEGEWGDVDTVLEGAFLVDDDFTGTYTFDSSSTITARSEVHVPLDEYDYDEDWFYESDNSVSSMSFSSGVFTASASSGGDYVDEIYQIMNFHLDTVSEFPGSNSLEATEMNIYLSGGYILGSVTLGDVPLGGFGHSLDFIFRGGDGGEEQNFQARGSFTSLKVIDIIATVNIADNKWVQIGLKTAPPVGSTVADIIGDDISAPYDTEWVLYSYDAGTNAYRKLSLTDTMHSGVGYWFIQTTGNQVVIDMPDESTAVNVAQHPACPSIIEGCFEIPLQTDPINAQWQMIGYPFRDFRRIDKLRIVSDAGECRIGCTLDQAQDEGLVSDTLWRYDGSSYQQLTSSSESRAFAPWAGAWIATLPAADGMALKLLIPATN